MCPSRSSARCSSPDSAGYTLIEVLVASILVAVVVLGMGRGFVFATRGWSNHQGRLQTQQSLRSAVAALSREVRLAGACMLPHSDTPPVDFQPLSGTHGATTDSITVRANPRCAQAPVVASGCASPCPTIPVATGSTAGFTAGMRAYILNGARTSGEYFQIQSVTSSTIVPTSPILGDYPAPDAGGNFPSVFGIEERTFAVATIGGVPTLTLQTRDLPQAGIVKGIDRLDIHYVLNRTYNAATCDFQTGGSPNLCVVNLPGSAGDWLLVRVVTFTVDARSAAGVRASGTADGFFHLTESFEITPRNFVFPENGRL